MKVELQAGDKINIPTGCKATIVDNQIIIEGQKEFKDGDILIIIENGRRRCPFIYKSTDKDAFHSFYAGINVCGTLTVCIAPWQKWGTAALLDYATEEEKQLLFDKIKERGLHWNAVEKQVEKFRERAKIGESYLCIGRDGEVYEEREGGIASDDKNYNSGNYYLPEAIEEAKLAAKAIKEIYQKRFILKP